MKRVTITGLAKLKPGKKLTATITNASGAATEIKVLCRIDTEDELDYWRNGGILHYVLRKLARAT